MTGKDPAKTLCAACRSLGLAAVRRTDGVWIVCDAERRRYCCVHASDLGWLPRPPPAAWLTGLDDFLTVRRFEHSNMFLGEAYMVKNKFYGMSREELELRLAVMGK